MENNDAHQCGTAQGQNGPELQDFLDVCGEWTLPPNGTHSMFRTLLFPRETTATRNCNMQRGLATNVSADKGSLARAWPWMSRDIPGDQDCHVNAQTADMPFSIPTTVSLRRLSKKRRRGGVVDSVEFSNITICIIRLSSDDLRLDTDACRMSLDDSRAPTLQNPPRRRSRTRFMWFR